MLATSAVIRGGSVVVGTLVGTPQNAGRLMELLRG